MGLSDDQSSSSTRKLSANTVMIADNINNADDAPNTKAHRSSPKKKDFSRSQHHVHHRESRRKLLGVRHLRRLENLSILLSQAEADEDDSGEVDFVDLVSHQNSAFRELFMEPDKMSTWVAFANSSEEEQENILASAELVFSKVYNVLVCIGMYMGNPPNSGPKLFYYVQAIGIVVQLIKMLLPTVLYTSNTM